MKVETPWTEKFIANLNDYQAGGVFHPYTCPGNKEDCGKHRKLIATEDGWVCQCGEYKQNWAHA